MGINKFAVRDVVTVTQGATIQSAARTMRDRHVGAVVVVKERDDSDTKIPVGILTDRDIVLSTVAFDLSASTILVEDVMFPTLITARVDDNFYQVLNKMKDNGIKRVPLLNDRGELQGIISADDIISVLSVELNDVAKINDSQRIIEEDRRRKLA